ncbi:hypothetical protein [Mucilaginibacter terrae]|uniref:Uncharacterized protein n=1 Tax=Mucilaginibacter terrae TaxID=1955052 RepID=A0ABU3GS84_9SPHI|nr:hypothetical protein [Mucilaginibacter terrae]MDT3402505.1 hypothetical protein [Mucilaginibacter terrae]
MKKLFNSGDIVRIRLIEDVNGFEFQTVELVTMKDYANSLTYKAYNQSIELYDYKWWEVQRFGKKYYYRKRIKRDISPVVKEKFNGTWIDILKYIVEKWKDVAVLLIMVYEVFKELFLLFK